MADFKSFSLMMMSNKWNVSSSKVSRRPTLIATIKLVIFRSRIVYLYSAAVNCRTQWQSTLLGAISANECADFCPPLRMMGD